MKLSVGLDKQSLRIAQKMARNVPEKYVRAGVARATKRGLKAVQSIAVKSAAKEAGLKQKFLRKISGIGRFPRGGTAFWIVAQNFLLHRLGRAVSAKGQSPAIAGGGALSKKVKTTDAFRIRRAILIREGRELRPFYAATRKGILNGFRKGIAAAERELSTRLHAEMERAVKRWRADIGR